MLSRLLRRLLLGQMLTGAVLGWFLTQPTDVPAGPMAAMALLLPLSTLLLVTLLSAIRSRAPGQTALWWRSLWGEYLAAIRVFMLQQPWAMGPPALQPATVSPPGIPVLLVHGYLCNYRVWDGMADRLRHAGHPVLGADLAPLFTSIDQYAPLVEQAVQALCRDTGAPKIVLIGHSMGGLVIRAWMRSHGTDRVARVITLGTPHAGTQIDPHPLSLNGQQMGWHSDWLQELAAGESALTRSLMRIAISPQDNIVYPQREQVLTGVHVTVFDGPGHLELCLDRHVIAWVIQQLEDLSHG